MTRKPEFKIIADHLRSTSFLIADGILPSNEGRCYVLRRIMRRAMLQLHKLGARQTSMYKLVDPLIKEMGSAYPELSRARAVIVETLKNEEEKFRETLEKGLKILEDSINYPHLEGGSKSLATSGRGQKFSGEIAFKLYDTYGFPLDLTQDILKEKNIEVDVEAFNEQMELQRERARANWKGSGEVAEEKIFFDLKEKFGATKFLGYETLSAKAKVLAIYPNFIILDQTPFYATSGGQKGDDGKIISGKNEIEISETKKFAGGLFVHFFKVQKNEKLIQDSAGSLLSKGDRVDALAQRWGLHIKVGDEVEAIVNSKTRQARACNHSATHLMHKALKEVLGNSISQKGSNVDADYFTFDFNFNRAMTADEIKKVEEMVSSQIKNSTNVNTKLMGLEDARNSGAEALFGEKYDSEVRVVAIANSVELCGGTHVKNTSDIEIFKIISEKSVASGIRRIEAVSGIAAKEFLRAQEEKSQNQILELREKIAKKDQEILSEGGAKADQSYLQESDVKILEEILKKLDKEIETIKKQKLLNEAKEVKSENKFTYHHFKNAAEIKDLRDIAVDIGGKNDSIVFLSAASPSSEESALGVIFVPNSLSKNISANEIIKQSGAKGGGKNDLATGTFVKKNLLQTIDLIKNQLKN